MSSPPVRVEVGPIARIVLDRPDKQNAMTVEMGRLMTAAVSTLNASNAPRVVLLEGEGRAFCAGGDFSLIEENSKKSPEDNRRDMLAFYSSFLAIARLRVPSIAVLHGAAVGAGLCLAMAADLRFAAREAKLGANFVRVGLHPGMGCTLLLPRLVGAAKAAELILTGKLISGEEALRIGLVNLAVPREQLRGAVTEAAHQIESAAPIAVAQAKETLAASLLSELDAALEREAACQALDFTTRDLKEAVAAFSEGRAPLFQGA
ncbi:MAG: enoyl-CoA hydratase/isomerase family protein [Myxococcales bacterium]|nr:enoyl-CoA hydratase/isomerase family protein [Myxococcales bacterium]